MPRSCRRAGLAVLLVAFGASLAAPLHAQSVERIFASGNEAYFHGDYARAAERYQRLVDAGVRDPDVYFDLGLAQARLGRLGAAVLSFERSLWLRAGDDVAEAELTAARALLGGKRAEREGEATVQARPPLMRALVRPISADAIAWSVLLTSALLFALLLIRPRVRSEAWRLGLAIAAPLVGLLLLTSSVGLAVKLGVFQEGDEVIVLRERAELREGPDPNAQVRTRVHEGDSARALRREAAFVELRLASGNRGWVASGDVGFVRPH